MNTGEPSQTALLAAAARAAHLIVDGEPPIFADTLAYELLGDKAEEFVRYHRLHGEHVVLVGARATATIRSHFTEGRLAEAVGLGVTQYVILGAGLDTFAYRHPEADGVRVFEVDHPSTQEWKRKSLGAAGIAVPEKLAFVPVDLETEPVVPHLIGGGFDAAAPAFVSWLGVVMYLTREAIDETLAAIGALASGTEIVLDYMLPEALRDEAGQTYVDLVAPASAERGEPWLTFLGPDEMTGILGEHGFEVIRHVSQRDAVDASLWDRADSLRPSGLSMLTHARVR